MMMTYKRCFSSDSSVTKTQVTVRVTVIKIWWSSCMSWMFSCIVHAQSNVSICVHLYSEGQHAIAMLTCVTTNSESLSIKISGVNICIWSNLFNYLIPGRWWSSLLTGTCPHLEWQPWDQRPIIHLTCSSLANTLFPLPLSVQPYWIIPPNRHVRLYVSHQLGYILHKYADTFALFSKCNLKKKTSKQSLSRVVQTGCKWELHLTDLTYCEQKMQNIDINKRCWLALERNRGHERRAITIMVTGVSKCRSDALPWAMSFFFSKALSSTHYCALCPHATLYLLQQFTSSAQ